jgi:hypothetical protein
VMKSVLGVLDLIAGGVLKLEGPVLSQASVHPGKIPSARRANLNRRGLSEWAS